MRGKFIVIEGIEGCGKTTQIEEISRWLPTSGLMGENSKLIKTREPGGSLLGQKLRNLILDNNKNNKPSSLAELLLYSADRAEHVSKIISPELEKQNWVISDRFADSTLAYQGYGRNINLEIIKNIESISHVNYASLASRPLNSSMSSKKIYETFNISGSQWKEELEFAIKKLSAK